MEKSNITLEINKKTGVKATIVDYNNGWQKAKLRIDGFQEDKRKEKTVYIWVDYADMHEIKNNAVQQLTDEDASIIYGALNVYAEMEGIPEDIKKKDGQFKEQVKENCKKGGIR